MAPIKLGRRVKVTTGQSSQDHGPAHKARSSAKTFWSLSLSLSRPPKKFEKPNKTHPHCCFINWAVAAGKNPFPTLFDVTLASAPMLLHSNRKLAMLCFSCDTFLSR